MGNTIKKVVRERDIRFLVHFTRAENLVSIFRNGILSVAEIEERGITVNTNDSLRLDYCREAVSLSIGFPNYKMFWGIRCDNPNTDWVVLVLEQEILYLSFETKSGKRYSVETTFQASKKFEHGGPYRDLLDKNPREAKRDERLKNSGRLIEFLYIDNKNIFPLIPKTLFYNWLYINTLALNQSYFDELLKYNAFTDIEFNPEKSINCQAIAAAIFISLYKNNLFDAPFSKEKFLSTVYESYEENDDTLKCEQLQFL